MLDPVNQDALNKQINHEFYSTYFYLSMSAYFETLNLRGFAHWMRMQSQEETSHAMKLFDYIHDRNGHVVLEAITQPPVEFQSPIDAFQQALAHERKVTETIHRLYGLAVQEKDYETQVELQWFIAEQVEEEKQARQILDQLKLIGDHGAALYLLDKELGERAMDS
jgi:ferritin